MTTNATTGSMSSQRSTAGRSLLDACCATFTDSNGTRCKIEPTLTASAIANACGLSAYFPKNSADTEKNSTSLKKVVSNCPTMQQCMVCTP